jgi:hypothetical protein
VLYGLRSYDLVTWQVVEVGMIVPWAGLVELTAVAEQYEQR